MPEGILNKKIKLTGHFFFWGLSFFFLSLTFYLYGENLGLRLFFKSIIINLFFAASVYFNLIYLIPNYLKQKNYIFYFFWLVLSLTIISLVLQFLFLYPLQSISNRHYHIHSFNPNLHSAYFFSSLFYVAITTFIKFMNDWFLMQDINLKLAKIEQQKLEAELKTLKSQLNPHFLFNSLNNIYSLSLTRSEKVPDLILKLSELMRHIIYESRENYIPLDRELDFVSNFIELQRIRTSEKTKIHFTISGIVPQARIAPLLFEPFIDNAFKHGLPGTKDNDFILINFDFSKEGYLQFKVENNFEVYTNKNNKNSGIGLENVKQRLNLLYLPNEYKLHINSKEHIHSVNLELKLK